MANISKSSQNLLRPRGLAGSKVGAMRSPRMGMGMTVAVDMIVDKLTRGPERRGGEENVEGKDGGGGGSGVKRGWCGRGKSGTLE